MLKMNKRRFVVVGAGLGALAYVVKFHKDQSKEDRLADSWIEKAFEITKGLIRDVHGKEGTGVKSLLDGSSWRGTSRNRGSSCSNLSGTWRNQLGSTVRIEQVGDSPKLTGRYTTAVESKKGAAAFSSELSGLVTPVDGGSLVAFNVLWNKGASLTAWVGECLECDGVEKLYTTWVLRSLQTPNDRWMSTRINQDTFWRVDSNGASVEKDNSPIGSEHPDLSGNWSASSGDTLKIKQTPKTNYSLEGIHSPGSKESSMLVGQHAGDDTYTALGLVAANQSEIKGWTGHIYNPNKVNKVLETSWLSQGFCAECKNPRKFVQFGMDDYDQNKK